MGNELPILRTLNKALSLELRKSLGYGDNILRVIYRDSVLIYRGVAVTKVPDRYLKEII
jgi:hypothetical protein